MTPLQKCREKRKLSFPALSKLLKNIHGGSAATLHRLENTKVNSVNKQLVFALVEVFKFQGLKENHITSPELFPDFIVDYTHNQKKMLCLGPDNEKAILVDITKTWIDGSSTSMSMFTKDLYKHLSKASFVEECPVTSEGYLKYINAAERRVNRIIEGEGAFPLEWKIHWLAALPENERQQAVAEIMALTGYMAVHLPVSNELSISDRRAKLDDITYQFSQVLSNAKPALDGVYDNKDCAGELQVMQDKLEQLISAAYREMSLIEHCTGITSKASQLWRNSPLSQ